jgi:hypothetical protein
MQSEAISLYLELEPGQKADLEVVARASLAFDAAIKELAYILDPSLEVRLELASGTEGSLSLNSLIREIKYRVSDGTTLKALAFTALVWFGNDLRTYGVIETLNHIIKPTHHLSDADIKKIAVAVEKAINGKIAKQHVQQVYRELERDTAVKGVGASLNPSEKPISIVPRERFLEQSGAVIVPDTTPQRRKKTTRERVTLISPVLLPNVKRRWKFYLPQIGEFGAKFAHQDILTNLLSGRRRRIPLKAGIQLEVLLDTIEEKQGDVWVIVDHVIQQVIRVRRAAGSTDADLFSEPPKSSKSQRKKKRKP